MLRFETSVKMLGTAIFEVVEAEGGQFFSSLEFGPEKKICSNLKTYFSIHSINLIYVMQFFFQISLIRHYFIHVQCGLSLRF